MALTASSLSRRLNLAGFRDHGLLVFNPLVDPTPGVVYLVVNHYHRKRHMQEVTAWLRTHGFDVSFPRDYLAVVTPP